MEKEEKRTHERLARRQKRPSSLLGKIGAENRGREEISEGNGKKKKRHGYLGGELASASG